MNTHHNLQNFEDDRCEDQPNSRFGWIPVWGFSLLFHVILLLVLTLVFTARIAGGVGDSPRTYDVEIAFKTQDGDRTVYEAADDAPQDAAQENETPLSDSLEEFTQSAAAGLSEMLNAGEQMEIPDLKSQLAGILPQDGERVGVAAAGGALGDVGKLHGGTFDGLGSGKVTFLGASGQGRSFTYVFDHSGSMSGAPLRVAKTELIQSLRGLKSNQQFQLVFYDHEVLLFSPGQLNFASDQNVLRAVSFISSIRAQGGTDHKAAIMTALKLRTDVVFFMTDADEPPLTAADLEDIRRAAGGTQIHTIHFGAGPPSSSINFLMKIAQQNRGDYHYINTDQLRN